MPETNHMEQERTFNEESYRSIIETIEDGYYEVDLFGRFTAFNHALTQVLGYLADELLGKSYEEYTSEETAELVRNAFRQVYDTGEPVRSFIWQIFRKDGRLGYIETSISPIRHPNGKIVGFRGIVRDVTNQKQIEEIFEQTEKTYRKTAVGASSFVFQFLLTADGKATFSYISEAARNLLEISRDQLQMDATHLLKFIHPEHAATLQQQLADSAQTLEAFQWEGIFYLASGQEKWFQTNAYPERLANADTLWYGFWTDITAQHAAQTASQRTQTVLQAMVEGTVSQVGEEFFRSMVKQLAQSLRVEHTFVTQFDAANHRVRSLAFWSGNHFQETIEYQVMETPCQRVLDDHFCIYEDDIQNLFPADEKLHRLNARSYLGIPLHGSEGEVLGHLVVLDGMPVREEALRRSVLQIFAARAGSELQQRLDAEKLAKQAADLETVAQISTAVAATRDAQQLLQDVVDLTRHRFLLYHAHIYLLDETSDRLVLAAGAGEVGRLMVAGGRTIPLHQEQSLVAQAARTHQGVIVNDVQQNPHFLPHPLLPHTRSEMAVPLLIGAKLSGVLDVQADQIGRFTPQDLNILTTLASQVAVTLENARSFEESEKARQALNQLTRRLTREGWENYLEQTGQQEVGYTYTPESITTLPETAETAVSAFTIPLAIQGEEIGQISLAEPKILTDDANDIIQAVAERLTAHIENLRLSDQTHIALAEAERQARNLAVINQVAQTVSQQIEPTTLLGTVYEQLQQVMAADAFMVALYDHNTHTIEFPVIYDEGKTYNTPPAPPSPFSNFYKVVQTREPLLINRTQEEMEERRQRATKSELIGNEAKISASLLYVPMQIGRETIGALSVQSYKLDAYSDADVNMLVGIANHVAVALENARLFAQTQAALTETELLYNVSAKLNAASNLEDVLQAVIVPAVYAGAAGAVLYQHELDENGQSGWVWATAATEPGFPLNVRFQMLSMPWKALLVAETNNAILIGNVSEDERLDVETKTVFHSMNVQAAVVMPLAVGNRWIGAIAVRWESPHSFTTADQRLYTVLAAQASVAADSLLLFAETQQRAAQLQKLAQLEVTLSLADNENQIIQALLDVIQKDKVWAASLSYFQVDAAHKPYRMDMVSLWAGGKFMPEVVNLYQGVPLASFPVARYWIEKPGEVLIVTDVETDSRTDEAVRQQAAVQGWKAIVLIPLRTSGQWQGVISVSWAEPYEPTAEELFIFHEVLEPASAVVGTRRAQLAQQQALAETETLYKATAQLNLAKSYDDIVAALREHTILGHQTNYITIDYFDHPWTSVQQPEKVEVLGLWGQLPVEHLPRVYPFAEMAVPPALLRPNAPTILENLATDTRLDASIRTFYKARFQAQSAVIVPLVVGGQWVGVANGMYSQETSFGEAEIRRLVAIASQAAVAVQTLHLLEETNRLLTSEQSQRRIADTLVQAARHMTGTLKETELRQVIVQEIEGILRPDQINLYEWAYDSNKLRLNLRWLVAPGSAEDSYQVDQVVNAAERPDLYQVLRENRSLLQAKENHPYVREHYCLPWYIGTEVVGVIEVYHTARHLTIREEDQARCEGVVRQAAVAMQSARLFEQEQRRAQREQVLREIAAKVRGSADVDSIMRTAVQEIGRVLGRRTYVYLDSQSAVSPTETKESSYEG